MIWLQFYDFSLNQRMCFIVQKKKKMLWINREENINDVGHWQLDLLKPILDDQRKESGAFALGAGYKNWFRKCRKDLTLITSCPQLFSVSFKSVRGTVNFCPLPAHLFIFFRQHLWGNINGNSSFYPSKMYFME